MPQLAELTSEDLGPAVLARLGGEVDLSTTESLERELWSAIGEGERDLVLDLSGLSFIDSSGLRLLVTLDSRLAERARRLRVVLKRGSSVSSLFEMTGLDRVLAVDHAVDDAAAALTS